MKNNMVCRLCLQNSSEVLEIFNDEGQELKIAMVIGKHFWFEPKIEDPVSSQICHSCWTEVYDFHEFYKYIEKAQQLLPVEAIVKTEYKLTVENVELASNHELEENIEEQYEEPFNITSNALADDLKDQSIEKKKDEQSEVCKKPNAFRGALYNHKHHVQHYDGKYVCNICKKSFKMAKSLKEHMLKHTGLSLYRCPHCSRTFKYISNMQIHRKQKHPNEFEEFRKLIKISSRKKEIIIPTISPLSDATNNSGELPSEHELEENLEKQCEDPFNITTDVLGEENYGVIEFEFPPDLKHQSIVIVNNEKKKDDENISAIHDDKEDESNLQDQIKDKKEILRKEVTKLKRSSERNEVDSLTEKATTAYKGRGRPRKGEVANLKKSLKDHMSKHSGLSSYRCLHCSRTFNHMSNMYTHRRWMHPKEFEELRKLRKISARNKERIIPTILKDQSIDIVNNMKKKDDKDISAIQDDKEDESDLQFQLKDKKILRKKVTKIKRSSSKWNKVESLTEKATTTYRGRGRPRKGEVAPLKSNRQSLKDHMSKHSGLSSYRCLHCSRTFNHMSNMYTHRKRMHPKEFEEFRKLRKISARSKERIIPTILKDQSIDIVNNMKKKDDKDISAIHDDKEDESNLQDQIKDKKEILRKEVTKLKRSSKWNKVESLTEKATTTYRGPGRPRKGEVAPLKSNRCLHCSRTFNHMSNMYTHRKRMHPKEYEEFRKLRKVRKLSGRSKEPIIPTISSLSDDYYYYY